MFIRRSRVCHKKNRNKQSSLTDRREHYDKNIITCSGIEEEEEEELDDSLLSSTISYSPLLLPLLLLLPKLRLDHVLFIRAKMEYNNDDGYGRQRGSMKETI